MITRKHFYCLFILMIAMGTARSQKVDSIYFNLYTDSLKKGVHNYINVDGKLSDGKWRPLTSKEIRFSASSGKFEGNSLIIDTSFKDEKVTVKAVLIQNPSIAREITIYMKKGESAIRVKTMEEVMDRSRRSRRNKKG